MKTNEEIAFDRNLRRITEITTNLINIHHSDLEDALSPSVRALRVAHAALAGQLTESVTPQSKMAAK